jgi:hypothetical protein
MVEALVGAMSHAESLQGEAGPITEFASNLRSIIHKCMVEGQGTRDLCGPEGLTTEQFVEVVAKRLEGDATYSIATPSKSRPMSRSGDLMPPPKATDGEAAAQVNALFEEFDIDNDGEQPNTSVLVHAHIAAHCFCVGHTKAGRLHPH